MPRDGKILIVEDNPTILRTLEEAGEGLRVTCERATDGWDAIEKLEMSDYDAIVIDADVAHHSGYGVLTYLREEVGEHLDNVILMTSSDRDEVRRRVGGGHLTVCDKADAVAEITRVMSVGRA
ncbi:MAG TPA: response regulator [Thermoanaerobaculia bacterium]|jgi:CheY-like chemotaxis protein